MLARASFLLPLLLPAAGRSRSHVLFVVVDDLGWDDVGFRSKEIRTPTIDSLATAGVTLNQYYVQDVCSPSRATFLTGRYAMHHGIVDWIPPESAYGLPLNETTMAQKFKEAGYRTAAVGKWHVGFYKWEQTPTFRGFDSFLGYYGGGEDYYSHGESGGYDLRRDPSPNCGKGCSQVDWEDKFTYSTHIFTREAIRVIDQHDTSFPLFLYLAYQGVHAPGEAPESYVSPYAATISDPMRRIFAGMLSCVDEGIRNVTAALEMRGMLNTTLIVFTSDNGGPTTTSDGVGARNWPLRGGKHSIWEGGVRATAVVSGHGIPRDRQGVVFNDLMHGADWLPTLADVAGYSLQGTLPLDGVSQWPAISGAGSGPAAAPARTFLVLGNSTNNCWWRPDDARHIRVLSASGNHDPNSEVGCGFGIRDGQWKLIKGYGGGPDIWCNNTRSGPQCRSLEGPQDCPGGWCLYDMVQDPNELHECSAENPGVVAELQERMARVLQSYSEYEIDTSCPPHKFVVDPHVGNVWEPWC